MAAIGGIRDGAERRRDRGDDGDDHADHERPDDRGRRDGDARWRGCRGRARRAAPSAPTASRCPRRSRRSTRRCPTSTASNSTEPSTWRCPAPMARSSASSRLRCATTIENVLKMMNEPTSSATTPKTSRNVLKNDRLSFRLLWLSFGDLLAADHLDVLGAGLALQRGADVGDDLVLATRRRRPSRRSAWN